MNAKDVTVDTEFLKTHIIGPMGTGKSVFASSCPTPGHILDFDGGILTYRGLDFDYDQFDISWKGWVDFEKRFRDLQKEIVEGKYVTAVIDSTTAMTDVAMERALQLDPKRSPTGGPIWNVHFMMVRNLMEGKLRQFRNLPCNIVLISHIDITTDDDGNILDIHPLLTGQLSEKIPGYFDEVYYATTKRITKDNKSQTQFVLQTITIGHFKARSRLSGKAQLLDDFIPNEYSTLMKQIKERIKPKTKTNKETKK